MQDWRTILEALQLGTLTVEQFTTRRYRARQANKRVLCLNMAKAYELYTLDKIHKTEDC